MSAVMVAAGRLPEEIVAAHPGFGVVEISTSTLRALGLVLEPDPVDGEPDHALVVGLKSQKVRRSLAKAARWVVRPPAAHPPKQ